MTIHFCILCETVVAEVQGDKGEWLCDVCAGKTIRALRVTLLASQREAASERHKIALLLDHRQNKKA